MLVDRKQRIHPCHNIGICVLAHPIIFDGVSLVLPEHTENSTDILQSKKGTYKSPATLT